MKTNRKLLTDYIKNVDDLQLSIIRAILVADAEKIVANKEDVKEEYKNSIVSPDYVIYHAENLISELGYK